MTQTPTDFEGAEFLRTRRMVLRGLRIADIPDLTALNADADVARWSLDPCPTDYFGVARSVVGANQCYLAQPGLGAWHASDLGGRFIGLFTLAHSTETGEVEIGTRLLPSVWGRLYPIEGGRALCAHAFGTLALDRILGMCHPQNVAVPAILRRLGFAADGEAPYFGGRALRFVLERDVWRSHGDAGPATAKQDRRANGRDPGKV